MNEKQKKLRLVNIILIGGIVAVIAAFPISASIDWLGIVLLVLGIAFIVASCIEKGRIKKVYCPNCNKKYDYENDVEWQEVSETVTNTNRSSLVEVRCHCRQCGHISSFSRKFTTGSVDKNGNVSVTSLEVQLSKFFR